MLVHLKPIPDTNTCLYTNVNKAVFSVCVPFSSLQPVLLIPPPPPSPLNVHRQTNKPIYTYKDTHAAPHTSATTCTHLLIHTKHTFYSDFVQSIKSTDRLSLLITEGCQFSDPAISHPALWCTGGEDGGGGGLWFVPLYIYYCVYMCISSGMCMCARMRSCAHRRSSTIFPLCCEIVSALRDGPSCNLRDGASCKLPFKKRL